MAGAFGAGLLASPLNGHALPEARAQAAEPQAQIDLAGIAHDDLPRTSNPEMNACHRRDGERDAGIAVGERGQHMHPKTEIPYFVSGSGSMGLGSERRGFKPATLIVIPKGTAHAGTIVPSGPVKAIAIEIPPQPADDVVFLD